MEIGIEYWIWIAIAFIFASFVVPFAVCPRWADVSTSAAATAETADARDNPTDDRKNETEAKASPALPIGVVADWANIARIGNVPTTMSDPGEATTPLFRGVHLSKVYRTSQEEVPVLDDAHFEIPRGITAIMGASGTGKSTLFNLLGAIDEPTEGELWFQSQRIWPAKSLTRVIHRQRNVAWVFQDLHFVEHLDVRDNVALPLILTGISRDEAMWGAEVYLERVGLLAFGKRRPAQLSRGQRQRVAVARALASRAPAILADEPTGSLDRQTADDVFELFLRLAREERRSVILVTHDGRLASQCDQLLCCRDRQLISRGNRRAAIVRR